MLVSGERGQPQSGWGQSLGSVIFRSFHLVYQQSQNACVASARFSLVLSFSTGKPLQPPLTLRVQPPIAPEGQQPPQGGRCYTIAGRHLGVTQGLWDFPYV